MAGLRVIDRLNSNMPAGMATTGETYEALYGKVDYTSFTPVEDSSDVNCGALANEMEFIRAWMTNLLNSFDLDLSNGDFLDDLTGFFLNLDRIFDEEDDRYRKRSLFFLRKKANPRWDTRHAIGDAFREVVTGEVFVEEQFIETDLMVNGGFETAGGGGADVFANWTELVVGSSVIADNITDQYAGSHCAELQVSSTNENVSVSQLVSSVVIGKYKFCAFYQDKDVPVGFTESCKLTVQRSGDSYYYNFGTNLWQVALVSRGFVKVGEVWTYASAFIDMPSGDGTRDLTFTLGRQQGTSGAYKVRWDRAMFGIWQDYPSVKVLLITGGATGGFLAADGVPGTDNRLDNGDCDSATAPAVAGETARAPTNATFVQSLTEAWPNMTTRTGGWSAASFKMTMTTGGSVAVVYLTDNESTSDMHDMVAESQYTLGVRIKVPSAGGPQTTEVRAIVGDYASAAWQDTTVTGSGSTGVWMYLVVTRTLRAGATGTRLRIEIDAAGSSTEYVNVDDLRLVPGGATDLVLAGYFDQDYIEGVGGGYPSDLYAQMLERIKMAGSKSTLETVSRAI